MQRLMLIAALLASTSASAQFGGFTWTLHGSDQGTGNLSADLMHVVGPDGNCDGGTTWFETVAPIEAHVSVSARYTSSDGPPYDGPVWLVDGKLFKPQVPGYWQAYPAGVYDFEFDVPAGKSFGLGVWSNDCLYGPGVADFANLSVTPIEWKVVGAAIDPQTGPVLIADSVGAVGDLDGDGAGDIVVGDPVDTAKVRVLSGATGATLLSEGLVASLGTTVAGTGDLDGDGTPDFAAGAPNAGAMQAGEVFGWSGVDGSELFVVHGTGPLQSVGKTLAAVGDLDGDGRADLAATSFGSVNSVLIVGGPDGHPIDSLGSGVVGDDFGLSVAGVGDADLDGVPDVLVGAPAMSGDVALAGRAWLFSGASGAPILEIAGAGKQFARTVSAAGDLDADGRADLLVADPLYAPGPYKLGRLAACSGLDGSLLLQVTGAPDQPLAGVVAGGADLDGDGIADLLGASQSSGVTFETFSGVDGSPIDAIPLQDWVTMPTSIALLGDVDGSGSADAAVVTGSVTSEFKALDGLGAPHLAGSGELAGGLPIALDVDHALPGAAALLVLGLAEVNLPLLGGVLVPQPAFALPITIDGAGAVHLTGHWPAGLPAGTSVWIQTWIVDPAGPETWTCTNGLVAIQPEP